MRKSTPFIALMLVFSLFACNNKPDQQLLEKIETPLAYYLDYYPNTEAVGATINLLLLKMSGEPAALNQHSFVDDIRKSVLGLREQYTSAYNDYKKALTELSELKKAHAAGKKSKEDAQPAFETLEASLKNAKDRIDQAGQQLQKYEITYDEFAAKFKEDPNSFQQHSTPNAAAPTERKPLETTPDGRGFVRPKN
ncbi:MAG: hypothetical protein NW218_20175 [Saprospiraceae bacterium]|nr:hypothetical protein [Saprospiraceae bacterium]